MNIVDNPTNFQLPRVHNKDVIPCIHTIATGNNFSTVYAPLIHDRSFIGWPLMKTTELVCATAFSDLVMLMMWSLFKLVNQIPHQPISQLPDFDSGTFLEHVMMHRLAHCLISSLTCRCFLEHWGPGFIMTRWGNRDWPLVWRTWARG